MAKEPLRYPLGIIDKRTDFMLFEELDYKQIYGGGAGTSTEGTLINTARSGLALRTANSVYADSKSVNSIILPIPGNISDSQALTYGEDNLNS